MKNDKFCVSKSLAYLVALVVAVVAGFYVMNYANTSKVTTNTEAAGAKCYGTSNQTGKRVSGMWRKNSNTPICPTGYMQITPEVAQEGFACCIPQVANFGAGGKTEADCRALKDKIAKVYGPNECTIYTGTLDKKRGECKVSHSGDAIVCSAGVGKDKKDREQEIKQLCKSLEGDVVPGSVVFAGNLNKTCRVYTGAWRKGGNPPPGAGLTYFCMTSNKSDIYVENPNGRGGTYKTENCINN